MKDFPVFTTENGVASLILKEIPYRKEAYIRILSSAEPEKLLEECASFCTACGAEQVLAAGHDCLLKYPLHTAIIEMRGTPDPNAETANLWPVTKDTVSQWRQICNKRMAKVPNAGTKETRDEKAILESGGAYFIHRAGELLGIGWIRDNRIEVIASVKPGAGAAVLNTLASLSSGEALTLEVASENRRAIVLYERLGFIPTREISRWYKIK